MTQDSVGADKISPATQHAVWETFVGTFGETNPRVRLSDRDFKNDVITNQGFWRANLVAVVQMEISDE